MNGPLCFIGTCGPWPQIHGKGTLVSATMWSAAMFALFSGVAAHRAGESGAVGA